MDKMKKTDRRASVGETLGVPTPDPEGTNLTEARALDSALAAARRLNDMSAGPKKGKKGRNSKKRRSSVALMEATEALFVSSSDEEKERDADGDLIPGLVSVSGSESSETSSSSSDEEEEDGRSETDSREVKEDRDTPETEKPEEPATAAPEPPAEKPSRKEIAPTPPAGAEAAPAPEGTFSHSPEVTPILTIDPVISLVSTTTSYSAGEGLTAETPGGKEIDSSIIETPGRQPEEPNTEDRRFIKPDEDEESVGDDHESDPDYELTDLTDEGSSTPRTGDPGADTPPPGFEDHATATLGVTAEQEEAAAQLEALKAQRVAQAQERLEREVQKRADEMFARRLAEEEEQKQRKAEEAAAKNKGGGKRPPPKKKSSTLEGYKRQRRAELEEATARAVTAPASSSSSG